MLQNYCYHNFQDLYNFGQRGACPSPIKPPRKRRVSQQSPDEPLDLSFKSESPDTSTASGFVLSDKNISYDESFKDNEEVEVVTEEDSFDERQVTPLYQKKGESVKEFVQKKIGEYNKSDSEFKVFVKDSSLKERDIKEKMSQIKEKYSEISSKIRRLEEKKEKLITQEKKDKWITEENVKYETKENLKEEEEEENKEPNNNDLTPAEDDNKDAIVRDDDARIYLDKDDLRDGQRVLVRLDNVMHPGRLTVIVPGDIYGVLVDKERGHKPHVFSREELLQRVVKDIKPSGVDNNQEKEEVVGMLRLGSRVCVYWSSMMNYLHPGIVTGLDDSKYVIVSTDDGDTRDVHINQVRLLPTQFSTLDSLDSPDRQSLPSYKIRTSSNGRKRNSSKKLK